MRNAGGKRKSVASGASCSGLRKVASLPPPTQSRRVRSAELTAEECFQQALDVARRQEAKSLELRAAMSLSRLWQQQGKRAEACELLAPIYGWFTEGFDTADLQEGQGAARRTGRVSTSDRTCGTL